MKLKSAMIVAGDCGKITRPSWACSGVEVIKNCYDVLSIECDLSIDDLDADDYEVV